MGRSRRARELGTWWVTSAAAAQADLHVEMGDIEKASVIYDEVIEAIQQEDVAGVAASSSWDC